MTQAIFAVIYCALLSSPRTGICSSSRSAASVIVNCMRGTPTRMSRDVPRRNISSTHIFRRCRREAGAPRMHSLFTQQQDNPKRIVKTAVHDENLEAHLLRLAKSWPWIRQYFHWHPSGQEPNDAEEIRRSSLSLFESITDSNDLLRVIEDKAAQEVGASILGFRLCNDQSSDKIHAVYRGFVSNMLPLSLDVLMQFFKSLLAGKAYARAYDVRKFIISRYPDDQTKHDLEVTLESFPEITPLSNQGDALSVKAVSTAMDRFSSCINNPWSTRSDLLSIWDDVEASDCLRRRDANGKMLIMDYDIRVFAKMVIDNSCAKFGDSIVSNAEESIHLLERICDVLRQRYKRLGEGTETKLHTLLWHAMILKGDLLPVRRALIRDKQLHLPDRARTITQLILASLRLESIPEAFEHLTALWPRVARHVDDASGRYSTKEMSVQSKRLRDTLFEIVEDVKDPAAWIATSLATTEARTTAAHLFCHLYRERKDIEFALLLFEGSLARKLPLSWYAHLVLMKAFLPKRRDAAIAVYRSLQTRFPEKFKDIESRDKEELHLGLRLFSLLGDATHAEEYFNMLRERGLSDRGAQRRLMHAYSVNGNTKQACRLFSEFFAKKPELRDFREIMYAHVRAGDIKGVNFWLDDMLNKKVQPDLGIFNTILLAFSTNLDLNSAMVVLQRMRESNVQPDHISYCTVMSIMAENKDSLGAEQLYQRAVEEGVIPDDIMILTLMNAHVEAGSWKGVIRAFDYLQQYPRPRHLNTALYNVLLKAYVLIGAPFHTVYGIFQRYSTLKLRPTERTYALLIQSACDGGRMDVAEELFIQLDALEDNEARGSHINIYTMTIIMAGFLRIGDKRRAYEVYEHMRNRGIRPTAVTFGVIIRSYANERSEESLRLAEDFIRSVLTAEESQGSWLGSMRGGRPKALDAIYGPLMSIYGTQLDVSQVEKYFDEMLAAGGQPGLVNLTMLMNAYRRVNNLEGVQHIWGEIVKLALHISRDDPFQRLVPGSVAPGEAKMRPRQTNILCIPLSVYISTLSAAGRHIEIAKTWRQLKEWGFVFDAHNWNHLAIALVRGGEVERAFEIVERVILPYQRQAFSAASEREKATTPLTFVLAKEEVEERAKEHLSHGGGRTAERRGESMRNAAAHEAELGPPLAEDPAQQLHELQRLSLAWQAWRPHNGTLDALSGALSHLQSGLRMRPEAQPIPPDEDTRRMSAEEAAEWHAKEQAEAENSLSRIYRNFPNTVQLVQKREAERKQEEETRSYA